MPDGIKLTYKGIDRQINRMALTTKAVQNINVTPIVNAIAVVWRTNFNSEGSMVGGWRPLTKMTEDLRASRGYQPAHPILKQTGGLKHAAIDSLVRARGKTAHANDVDAVMSYTSGNNAATLRISGRKVTNQFRSQSRRRGSTNYSAPPRPFWFVNADVLNAAQQALIKGVRDEVRGL